MLAAPTRITACSACDHTADIAAAPALCRPLDQDQGRHVRVARHLKTYKTVMGIIRHMKSAGIGDNSQNAVVTVESRLFNSLTKFAGSQSWQRTFTLPAGSTIADLVAELGLPQSEIFLVLKNGRDVSSGLVGATVNLSPVLSDGDVIAFSGPVPYSYGYGAPVV